MESKSISLEKSKWTLVGPLGPEVPSFLLAHSIIAVDGGARYTPHIDMWTGDSDSYSGQPIAPQCYPLSREKSKSDLGHALDLMTHLPNLDIHLWGFLGGRRDHELINFGEVAHFSKTKDYLLASFYASNGNIEAKICSRGSWSFDHIGTFSVISFEEVKLQIRGQCKYLLEEPAQVRPVSSQTLSNEAYGIFDIISDKPFIVLFTYED